MDIQTAARTFIEDKGFQDLVEELRTEYVDRLLAVPRTDRDALFEARVRIDILDDIVSFIEGKYRG
jgi:hypothetical protein